MDEKARENNRLRQRKFLELHKDEVNNKRRERYHERLSLGKCPRCGSRAKKGRTLCSACGEYMLGLNRKYAKRDKAAANGNTAKTSAVKMSAVKTKAVKAKAVKAKNVKASAVKAKAPKAKTVKTGAVKAKAVKAKAARTKTVKAGAVKAKAPKGKNR